MYIRVVVICVLITVGPLLVLADDHLLPLQTSASARIESAIRSDASSGFRGQLRFIMEQSLSPERPTESGDEPVFIRQSWQIETDGEARVVGRVQYEVGSNVKSPLWFGENRLAIWWTHNDSLIILHKSYLNSDRSAEHQVEAESIRQLVRQARQEIGNVLGAGRLADTNDLRILKSEPTGSGFDVDVGRGGIPSRVRLDDVGGALRVTSRTDSYPGAVISWEFEDFRTVDGLSFPASLKQESVYSDGRRYKFTYRDVGVTIESRTTVFPRRLLEPSGDREILNGVNVVVTHGPDKSSVTSVAK